MILISTPYDKGHYFYKAFNSERWSKYHFKTSDNPLVTKTFLDQQREEIGETQFRQEYLAEFVDEEDTYLPMALLRSAVHLCDRTEPCDYCDVISGKSQPSGELYGGYDPGGMKDPAAFVLVEKPSTRSGDEAKIKPSFKVILTKTFLSKKAVDNKKSDSAEVYTQFTSEIAEIRKKLNFRRMLVDSTGIGSPILEHCKELKLPAEGLSMNRVREEEIFSNLKILLEQKKITLPDSLELLSSLNSVTSRKNRIGGLVFDHASGTHDDLAFALALALWAARVNPTIVVVKY